MGVDLSIVIPAYNEAHKIARDIAAASAFLTAHKFSGEIIIADDAGDHTTESIVKEFEAATEIAIRSHRSDTAETKSCANECARGRHSCAHIEAVAERG